MTLSELNDYLKLVKYKNWYFSVRPFSKGGNYFLQLYFDDEQGEAWKGRKWLISPHATKSEVIQTAFKAVLTAEEHEIREKFKYKGQAIFGPHFNVDRLVDLCETVGCLEPRP